MTDSDLFKYDVRIRERMIRRGLLSETEVKRYLDGLPDAEAKCDTVPQRQPALGPGEGPDLDSDEDDDEDDAEEAS